MAKFRAVPPPRSEDEFIRGAEATPPPSSPVLARVEPGEEEAEPKSPESVAAAGLPITPPKRPPTTRKAPRLPPAAAVRKRSGEPWEGKDPRDKPTVNLTVRLNDYQYAQLQYLVDMEDRSQAQILRRLLGPALDEAVKRVLE